MKPIGDTFLAGQTSTAVAAWRARAVQKASVTADLRGEGWEEPQHAFHQDHQDARSTMHHNGTPGSVPFRDELRRTTPRLTAAFTAQLLGQILPDPERRPSAAAAYDRETLPLALGFDTKL